VTFVAQSTPREGSAICGLSGVERAQDQQPVSRGRPPRHRAEVDTALFDDPFVILIGHFAGSATNSATSSFSARRTGYPHPERQFVAAAKE
jgi:hypothetical protein